MTPEEQPPSEAERVEAERVESEGVEAEPIAEVAPLDPVAHVAPIARTPAWGWRDVILFIGLSLPIIALVQIVIIGIAKVFHHPAQDPVLAIIGQTIAYPIVFALLASILRSQYGVPFWPSMGWVPPLFPNGAAIVLGVFLAFGLAMLGGLLRIPDVDSPINKLLGSPDSAILLALFGILVAPLAEELAFRGFLQPLLVRSLGVFGGIATTAVLFGMMHWQQNSRSWEYVGIISLAGAGFGVLRHFSGSTRTSMLAHVAYNSTLFLAYFTYGRKSSI